MNRRRIYLINKKYQWKFIAAFIGVSLLGIISTVSAMYYFLKQRIEENLYRSHIKISDTGDIILPVTVKVNILFFLLGVFVIALLSYYYSRRMGRLVNGMVEVLDRFGEGRLDFDASLEEEDFPGLGRHLGKMIESNNKHLSEIKKCADELSVALSAIPAGDRESLARAADGLKEKVACLEDALGFYSTETRP
jgi:methyl-accepting chemotaxis protein